MHMHPARHPLIALDALGCKLKSQRALIADELEAQPCPVDLKNLIRENDGRVCSGRL